MSGRHERICGYASGRLTDRVTKTGEKFVTFDVGVNDYEDGTSWYTIYCLGAVADLALEEVQKGKLVTVEGETRNEPWTDKAGKSRDKMVLRATMLHVAGGGSATFEATKAAKEETPERTEREISERYLEDVLASPMRWQKPGFKETWPEFAHFEDEMLREAAQLKEEMQI